MGGESGHLLDWKVLMQGMGWAGSCQFILGCEWGTDGGFPLTFLFCFCASDFCSVMTPVPLSKHTRV